MSIINHANYFDIAILLFGLASFIFSYSRGFIKEMSSILKWVVASTCALTYNQLIVSYVIKYIISDPFIADLIAMIAVFTITAITIAVVMEIISINVKSNNPINHIDSVLGAVWGGIKAATIVCFVYWMAYPKYAQWPQEIKKSHGLPYIKIGAQLLDSLLPQNIKQLQIKGKNKSTNNDSD